MRPVLTVILFVLIMFPALSVARAESYMDMEIPVMEGATNVKDERDDTLYQREMSYDIVVKKPIQIFEFYDAVFEKEGWVKNDFFNDDVRWTPLLGRQVTFTASKTISSQSWNKNDLAAKGAISVILNEYSSQGFKASVNIGFAAEIGLGSKYVELMHLLAESPKNLFILNHAVGEQAMQFKNINLDTIDKKYANETVVKEYIKIYKDLRESAEEFADIYIRKTKPIPPESNKDPLEEWRKIQEKHAGINQDLENKEPPFPDADVIKVILSEDKIRFEEEGMVLVQIPPLPLLSWNSGVCFDIGAVENDSEEARKALLDKVFGSHQYAFPNQAFGTEKKDHMVFDGQLFDKAGNSYALDGYFKKQILMRPDHTDKTLKMIVCSCVSCDAKSKEKPNEITSIKIIPSQSFVADSVYWYSYRSQYVNFTGEDPLERWRALQEERVERELKAREAEKEKAESAE